MIYYNILAIDRQQARTQKQKPNNRNGIEKGGSMNNIINPNKQHTLLRI